MSSSKSSKPNNKTQANHAYRALNIKTKTNEKKQTRIPQSRTAGDGQIREERADAPTSGALQAEGHRPVLERSRKVR